MEEVKCSNENTKMRCLLENVYAFDIGMLDINTEIFQVMAIRRLSTRSNKTYTHYRVLQVQSDKSTNAVHEQNVIYRHDAKAA